MLKRLVKLPKTKSFFLFGPRQVGKSTLIQEMYTKDIWEVNFLFNDIYLAYSKNPSLFRQQAIEKIKNENIKTIFIDEVQRIPEILNEVQYLMQSFECQFILTGSSARKLKRGGANLLGGRALERSLFPFTYYELEDKFNLDQVLAFGSLPPIIELDDEEKIDSLSAYVSTYLREEIKSEGLVRNLGGFSRFLDIAASQFGELINFSSIARESQLTSMTVKSYYEILEDTLIAFKLEPWRRSVKKRLSAHPKYYFFDCGVVNAINKRLSSQLDNFVKGRLFEQWIVLETQRYISYLKSEASIFFWRTGHGAEVDLLIEKHGELIAAIEIKLSSNISGAHLSGLRAFAEDKPKVAKYLVSTVFATYELDGVKILGWKDYLKFLPELLS